MKNIFNDSEFEKFLYGGIKDLDEPVGKLVHNLYRAGIKTTWSCSGHIYQFNEDAGGKALPENQVYQCGKLFYCDTLKSLRLTKKLEEITKVIPFASLTEGDTLDFALEMDDLIVPRNDGDHAKKQIPIKLAEQRYSQFLGIWKDLTDWSELK